jgi:hypothetical protein
MPQINNSLAVFLVYLRSVIICVSIGPIVGALLFCLSGFLEDSKLGLLAILGSILLSIFFAILGTPIAYLLGTIPSILAGIFYAAALRILLNSAKIGVCYRLFIGTAVGFLAIILSMGLMFWLYPNSPTSNQSPLPLIRIGTITGAVMAVFILGRTHNFIFGQLHKNT